MKIVSRSRRVVAVAACAAAVAATAVAGAPTAQAAPVQILRVGTWNGIPGNEPSIDAAMTDFASRAAGS